VLSLRDGTQVTGRVTDNQNGTYTVVYSPVKSGKYALVAELNADAVKESPFTVAVAPASRTVPLKCTIELTPDAKQKRAHPGRDHFSVIARDTFGNPKLGGGDPVKVMLSKLIRRPAAVHDNGDGTYSVKCPYGLEKGQYDVHVEVGGEKIPHGALPEQVEVQDPESWEEELSAELAKTLPESSAALLPLLLQVPPEQRRKFVEELKTLKTK